jgi:geranylgeranyl pyrophosphate synthase
MLGALLAGTTKEMLRYLESYGVATGILFQIRDDRLDGQNNPFTDADIDAYKKAAEESIMRLSISEKDKQILKNLFEFVVTRTT